MHCTRPVLHTFAGKLGKEGDGEAPRGDSKRSKDTNLAPARPAIGKEARMGRRGAGFLCQQSNKRRVRRGGVVSENAHALCSMHKIYQLTV